MSTKVIKTLTITSIPGGSWPILGGTPKGGAKAQAINCSTFEDLNKAFIAEPQPELTPLKFRVGMNGVAARPTVGAEGAAITVLATYTDASTDSNSISGFIESCEPNNIEVNGDHVPVWEIEFRPSGGGTTNTTSNP